MNKIKIKTIYGKILTITIQEQTSEYISGLDKNGIFTKIQIRDIENSIPLEDSQ
jgi:hypothetical protein